MRISFEDPYGRSVAAFLLLMACRTRAVPERSRPVHSDAALGAPSPTQPPSRPVFDNVLFLTVDALRADQPWTGYTLARTPYLSSLAERSIVYTRAYAVANYTTASLTAMLSGRYPTELARDRCALTSFTVSDSLPSALRSDHILTIAVHGHPLFAGASAPSKGFATWRLVPNAAGRHAVEGASTGEDIASIVSDFLRSQPARARFFAWAHFVEPHDRYVRHDGFLPSRHPTRGVYDGEVAYVDSLIGSVLDVLAASVHGGRTAVVITADHGEAFGEHGAWRHGSTLFDEEVRVPLLFFLPGVAPRRIDVPRSTIDVTRTLANLVDVAPSPRWHGHDLADDWADESPAPRTVLIDTPDLDRQPATRAVVMGETKVMLTGRDAPRAFALAADPTERSPLAPPLLQRLIDEARHKTAPLTYVASVPCELTKQAR